MNNDGAKAEGSQYDIRQDEPCFGKYLFGYEPHCNHVRLHYSYAPCYLVGGRFQECTFNMEEILVKTVKTLTQLIS